MTLQSLSKSTLKQYTTAYKEWWIFCSGRKIDYLSASISEVLQFLQYQYDNKTIKYGTFNNYRSALSLILPEVGTNPLVCRWIKGVSRVRPPARKYNFTWDPNQVIDMLEKWYPNGDLSLEKISKKLSTLLALTTAHRMQTLSLIKVENIHISPEKIQILIPDVIKTTNVRSEQPCLQIPFFTERPQVCVASTLLAYLEKTAPLRSEVQNHLFLGTRKPYLTVGTQTLSRWIKATLAESGINTEIFGGYSAKHAAVSAAFRNGVLLRTIRKTAGWAKNSSTFTRFYNIPINNAKSLTEAVLGKKPHSQEVE